MRSAVWRMGACLAGALAMALVGSLAQAQPFGGDAPFAVMPGSAQWRASLPPMPHEQHPDTWPQPDYFTSALSLTPFKPGARFRALSVRAVVSLSTRYLALPVQTQAFGFAPAFNAVVGAELDWLLAASGLQATGQTAVIDAYGPMARRLDEADINDLARNYPKQKLLGLYLGHDGVDHAFLTLVVQAAEGKRVSHKTIELPDDRDKALEAIAAALPDLVRRAGLEVREAAATTGHASCERQAWGLADLPSGAPVVQQACHALALGTLLPTYGVNVSATEYQLSPAKLAWLARAYVLGKRGLSSSAPGGAIRDLAFSQLGMGPPGIAVASHVSSTDPVVAPIARLLSLFERTAKAPVRSQQAAKDQEVERMQADLPVFSGYLLGARADINEPFSRLDFCEIEWRYPGGMPSAKCPRDPDSTVVKPARPASQAEKLLYQDWRIAAGFKDFAYYAVVQGRKDKARETWQRLSADVAEHPFLQRIKYAFEQSHKLPGDFDAQLARGRGLVRDFVQATVNYPRNDTWYDGHSLAEHGWTDNFNVMNDVEVSAATSAERRLLAVMKFDRFGSARPPRHQVRKPGEPAYFLAPSIGDVIFASMPGGLDVRPVEPPRLVSGVPSAPAEIMKPPLFSPHMDFTEEVPKDELQKRVASAPQSLEWRTELALSMLKDGASLQEALKVIDARLPSQRSDDRVAESHNWAYPAHALYFAGEVDAAKKYYERVARIGSGSDSDLLARVRVPQIEGRFADALVASQSRLARYDGEFAWFDTASLLFMTGQSDRAWVLLKERIAAAEFLPVWGAVMTGHRLQGANLAGIQSWLRDNRLQSVQINRQDVDIQYLHMQAVMDRLPSDRDIALLRERRHNTSYVPPQFGSSARLHRAVLENGRFKEAYDEVVAKAEWGGGDRSNFMLPLFTWVAWQATEGKDRHLVQVRQATTGWDFDNILAKSMLLALEGQLKASMHFFRAARYAQAQLGLGDDRLIQRAIPPSYDYALAGYLMYKKTGQQDYRDETLRFVRAYQRIRPQSAWLYGMQAMLDPDKKQQKLAACRARALDTKSYFLSLAGADLASGLACPAKLW